VKAGIPALVTFYVSIASRTGLYSQSCDVAVSSVSFDMRGSNFIFPRQRREGGDSSQAVKTLVPPAANSSNAWIPLQRNAGHARLMGRHDRCRLARISPNLKFFAGGALSFAPLAQGLFPLRGIVESEGPTENHVWFGAIYRVVYADGTIPLAAQSPNTSNLNYRKTSVTIHPSWRASWGETDTSVVRPGGRGYWRRPEPEEGTTLNRHSPF